MNKEREPVSDIEFVGEEMFDEEPMEEELDGYIERVEKAGELQKQTPADDQGHALVQHTQQSVQLPDDAVVLPMTQQEFEEGMGQQLYSSGRWLAEWCLLMIKKYGRRVFFKG